MKVRVWTDGDWAGSIYDGESGETRDSTLGSNYNIAWLMDEENLPYIEIEVRQVNEKDPFVIKIRRADDSGIVEQSDN